MGDAEIYFKLTEIFRDIFDDDTIILLPETTAADIPEWDSVNHINLTVAAESAFRTPAYVACAHRRTDHGSVAAGD